MITPINTLYNISKFLSRAPYIITDDVLDISPSLIYCNAKYNHQNILTHNEIKIKCDIYMTHCLSTILNNNILDTILIPLVFKDFIDTCIRNKLFSKLMINHLIGYEITYHTYLTFGTCCDIIDDFLNTNTADIFESLSELQFFINSFEIYRNNIHKFSTIIYCMPNISHISNDIIRPPNILITDLSNRKRFNNIEINHGYKQLISKLRQIEKEQKNNIRELNIDKVISYNQITMLRKEITFFQTPEYRQIMNLIQYSIIFITILFTLIMGDIYYNDIMSIYISTYCINIFKPYIH